MKEEYINAIRVLGRLASIEPSNKDAQQITYLQDVLKSLASKYTYNYDIRTIEDIVRHAPVQGVRNV